MHSLEDKLEHLRKLDQEQLNLAMSIMKADGGNFYSLDFLVLAALNRSRSNIGGFISLIEIGNYCAAAPIVRMQLDSVLRLFATQLVDDPQELSAKILDGLPVSKMRAKNGNKMTDSYLLSVVAKTQPWVEKVYESSSGFVHLSNKHMFMLFSKHGDDGVSQITIGQTQNYIPEKFRVEAVEAISHITKLIIYICNEWLNQKQAHLLPVSKA